MNSRLSLFIAALSLLGASTTAADIPRPGPSLTPERVVKIQLEALQRNDVPQQDAGIAQTWAFAHPDNKSIMGPLELFTAMIKGPYYQMLVDHREHAVKRVAVTPETALVAVTVEPASGPVVFYQWKLEKVHSGPLSGAWMTVAVSLPALREDTI